MTEKKFTAMLTLIVPQVVSLIAERNCCDEVTAAKKLYNSKVYAIMEQEDTKLWHLSALTLFDMFNEEEKNGVFVIPEET